jgi:hypothetical protein
LIVKGKYFPAPLGRLYRDADADAEAELELGAPITASG